MLQYLTISIVKLQANVIQNKYTLLIQ